MASDRLPHDNVPVPTADPEVRHLLEAVTANLTDGVAAIDQQGTVRFVNPAAELLTGRSRGDLVGRRWSEVVATTADLAGAIDRALNMCRTARITDLRLTGGRSVSLTVTPITRGEGLAGAVLVISDLSTGRRAEIAEAEIRDRDALIDRLRDEIAALERMAGPGRTPVTADTYGFTTLRESARGTFDRLVAELGRLLGEALDARGFRVDRPVSTGIRDLGEQIGRLGGGPRDVIDIYRAALEGVRRPPGSGRPVAPAKARAYIEEGRLIVLELMGDLVSFYRRHAQPSEPTAGPATRA